MKRFSLPPLSSPRWKRKGKSYIFENRAFYGRIQWKKTERAYFVTISWKRLPKKFRKDPDIISQQIGLTRGVLLPIENNKRYSVGTSYSTPGKARNVLKRKVNDMFAIVEIETAREEKERVKREAIEAKAREKRLLELEEELLEEEAEKTEEELEVCHICGMDQDLEVCDVCGKYTCIFCGEIEELPDGYATLSASGVYLRSVFYCNESEIDDIETVKIDDLSDIDKEILETSLP